MNAPESLSLSDRILAAVAKATSQRPERAADVLAKVGGEESAFWTAIEQLYAKRCINTAHIKRKADAEPWLAVWPTGLPLGNGAWSGSSHSALFVKHRPNDLYDAHAPRSVAKAKPAPTAAPKPKTEPHKEPVMDMPTNNRRPHGTLQDALAQHLTGRGVDNAMTVAELANLLCDEPQNIRFAVQAMAKKGVLLVTERKNGGRTAAAYYDAVTVASEAPAVSQETAAVPTVAEELAAIADALATAEPEPAAASPAVDRRAPQPLYRAGDLTVTEVPADATAQTGASTDPTAHVTDSWECAARADKPESRIEFALWSDGRLDIVDGDELFQIPPGATKRLALLLGVPGTSTVSSLGA